MMIDNKLLEEVLQFYNCPCEVIDTRTGGGYCDFILSPIAGTTLNKLNARTLDFSAAIGQPVSIAFENMQIIFRVPARPVPVKDPCSPYTQNRQPANGKPLLIFRSCPLYFHLFAKY